MKLAISLCFSVHWLPRSFVMLEFLTHVCETSNYIEASSASLSEHPKSRRMICGKSSVTCSNFDGLRKVQDQLVLHTRLCARFAGWSLLVLLSLKITFD